MAQCLLCFPSPAVRLLPSGHTLSHVALSPGAPSSSWVGWILSQICRGKSLELGLSKDEVSVCRLLLKERCASYVGAVAGGFSYSRVHAATRQKCPYRTKGRYHRGSHGFLCLWFRWPVQLFSLLLGWLASSSLSQCPLQKAASLESVMWDQLREALSTTLNCGKLGWGRQGSHPRGRMVWQQTSGVLLTSTQAAHHPCPPRRKDTL